MSVRQTARSALAEPHPRAWRWYLAGCLVAAAAYSVLGAAPPYLHGLPRTLLHDSVGVASSVAILLGSAGTGRPGPCRGTWWPSR